jgi:uncharacterized phage protein (TIGR02218 family)
MSGTVYGVTNRATFNSQDIAAAEAKYFQYGYLTWTGGKNAGLSCEISDHTVSGTMAFLTLLEPAAYPISIGDTYTIYQGCPRTRAGCVARGNVYNFRGCPDMPTEDLALTTPNYSQDY